MKGLSNPTLLARNAALMVGLLASTTSAQAPRNGYSFLADDDAPASRWVATIDEPGIDTIDPRQSVTYPTTRLHVTFDEEREGSVLELVSGQLIPVEGLLVEGARGQGIELTDPVELSFDEPLGETWSLTFWLRIPEEFEGDARTLLELPGSVRVVQRGKSTLAVNGHELPVEPGWMWIGLARETFGKPRFRVATETSVKALRTSEATTHAERIMISAGVALDDLRIERVALSTAALRRVAIPPRVHTGGGILIRASGAERRARLWPTVAPAAVLRGDALLNGWTDHFELTEDRGLSWVPGQWRQEDTDAGPMPRTTHPTVSIGDGKVLLFGGETTDSHITRPQINDAQVWTYDVRQRSWEQLSTTGGGPSPRCHLSAAFSPEHNAIFLAGGWCNGHHQENRLFTDAWTLDLGTNRWESWKSRFPHGFSDSSLIYAPQLGGGLAFVKRRGAYFNLDMKEVQLLPASSIVDVEGVPTECEDGYSRTYAADPIRNRVIFYGGQVRREEEPYHSELLAYEWETRTLRVLSREGPEARVRPGFAYDSLRDQFVMFGGVRGQFGQRFDDLWVLDPRTDTWSELRAASTPSRRGGYFGMAYDRESDCFYLLCGRHAPNSFLDEAWRLHLDQRATARARFAFEAEHVEGKRFAFVEGVWDPARPPELRVDRLGTRVVLEVSLAAPAGVETPSLSAVGFGADESWKTRPGQVRVELN